jgi:septum site-determining protein MinC
MISEGEKAIELEGVVTALNVLRVLTTDRAAILAALDRRIAETPGVFRGAPVVIDLTQLEAKAQAHAAEGAGPAVLPAFPLATLAAALKERELVPVGASVQTEGNKRAAVTAGLGLFDATARPVARGVARKRASIAPPPAASIRPEPIPESSAKTQLALTLVQPLRAGQIVYAKERDVIALAAVNAGAELIADGNIHVYGPLRGRALAGASGNEQARIYCQKLEADLVSIAGVYVSKDQLPEDKLGKPVQIFLQAGDLVIADLTAR